MSEWYRENRIADLTLRIANAKKYGHVILEKKLQKELNEIRGLEEHIEIQEEEEKLLNEN